MLRTATALLAGALAGAACGQDIVVGQVLPLSGASAVMAQELQRGREACTRHVNAQGGVRGRMLRLLTRDDQGDASRAVAQARELVERESAVVLLGSMGPGPNSALIAWARGAGVAVVGPYGGDIEVRLQDEGTAFFLTANQSAEAERLAAHIGTLGLARVAIVHAQDRAGVAALTALEEGLGVANVAAAAVVAVRADGSNAAEAAKAALAAGAQGVLLATRGQATAAMLKALVVQARASATPMTQIYGLSSAASPAELQGLSGTARGFVMTQVLPLPRDARVPMVATFLRAMHGAAGERTYAELEGCVAPLLLAEVLRRKPLEPGRAGVLQALRAAGKVDLGGFDVDLGASARQGQRFTDIVFVGADGRLLR